MPAAVWVTNGTKLLGTPFGNSPIIADGCAPIGLKYRSKIAEKSWYETIASRIMSSHICLVFPYGEVAVFRGAVSSIGNLSGCPYTVHDDEKIMCFILFLRMSVSNCISPKTLFR